MESKTKRVRTRQAGFVGVMLSIGGDMSIYNRLLQEVESDPELSQSKIIRLALKEYFDRKDSEKTK